MATANVDTPNPIVGKVLAIFIKYNDTPPATTDVVIKTKGLSPAPPTTTILTRTNTGTDGLFYPRAQVHDSAGTGVNYAATFPIYEPVPVHDKLNISIAQANDNDSVDVWLLVDQGDY
ncbi:MAG: hypothetical protein ACRD1K_20735 [Acidimicrobiales bacterium]